MDIIFAIIRVALALAPPHVVKAALEAEADALTADQIARAERAYEQALREKFGRDDDVAG